VLAGLGLAGCSQIFGLDSPNRSDAGGGRSDGGTDVRMTDAAETTAWWDPGWSHRRKLTLATQELSGTVTNFPVLVRLTPSMFSAAAANGADIRFVAGDGLTVYAHDLETADNASMTFWVRAPALKPSEAQTWWVYYGNANAGSSSSPVTVFGADYVSVHHLGDLADATGHGHSGSIPTSGPASVAGVIANARSLDGVDDEIVLADEIAYDFTTAFSVSVWFKVTQFTQNYQALVAKADTAWRVHRDAQGNVMNVAVKPQGGGNNLNLTGTVNVNDGQWHHALGVMDQGGRRLFIDGQLDASVNGAATIATNDYNVAIGSNENAIDGKRFWNGVVDEVRISATIRDAAWANAEYVVVTSNSFLELGPEETGP